MILYKTFFIFCVFQSIAIGMAAICNNGAPCINLRDCEGLYNQLTNQKPTPTSLTTFLKSLHCGFSGPNEPMICCPPEFQSVKGTESRIKGNLLPDFTECGIQNNDRIVGGVQADLDEHPWMALLRYDRPNGWDFYCGGVLISSKYVLTAAHCVKGDELPTSWRLSQVRLGEWNVSSTRDCVEGDCSSAPLDIPVEEVIPHEGYDPLDSNQEHDIALLRLSRNVQFNDFVMPICLPQTTELKNHDFNGFVMEVAGWGKTESRSESDVKLKVKVPIMERTQCASVYNRVHRVIKDKQLCAGGVAGKDSCRGDSGGALMARVPKKENWIAAGVVSYGPTPCGTKGWPGVYTRVGAYMDWILSKVKA